MHGNNFEIFRNLLKITYICFNYILNMLLNIAERHKLILKKLEEKGFVEVADLSQEFDVSLVTIMADIFTSL